MQPLVRGPLHAAIGLGEEIDDTQQSLDIDCRSLLPNDLEDVGGHLPRLCLWIHLENENVSEMADQIAEQFREILACLGMGVDFLQCFPTLLIEDDSSERGNGFGGIEAENFQHIRLINRFPAERDELIQHRLGVPHPAFGALGDGKGGGFAQVDSFLLRNEKEMGRDDIGRNPAKIESLTPTDDGGQNLLGLGRREDEFHMGWRLFQRLEKGIERCCGQHVHLIDVVDLELPGAGSKLDRIS